MKKLFFPILSLFLLCTSLTFASSKPLPQEHTPNTDIQGDALYIGGSEPIEKNIQDDAFIIGDTVTINGNIGDDLRVAGLTITINGNIGDNGRILGNNVTLHNTHIGGTLNIHATNVKLINIQTNDTIHITAKTLFFNSAITGVVSVDADEITFGKNAHITGNFLYSGKINGLDSQNSLTNIVEGNITKKESSLSFSSLNGNKKLLIIAYLTSITLFSFVLQLFLPKYFSLSLSHILSAPFKRFISGCIWIIGSPLIGFILLLTIIGYPFGITLIAIWGISLLLLPYISTSILSSLFLRLFKWKGFFATFVVTLLSALISVTPLSPFLAPFIFGGILKEKMNTLLQYK